MFWKKRTKPQFPESTKEHKDTNYFWFSYKQATCFKKENMPRELYAIMQSLPETLGGTRSLYESMLDHLPNTITIDGKRVAYSEWTTNEDKPSGNWDDYIFVGKCKGWPKDLRINDPLWEMFIPSKYQKQ